MPEMVRFYTVSSARTVIGSAFGGLIYITLPEGLKLADQTITVTGDAQAGALHVDTASLKDVHVLN